MRVWEQTERFFSDGDDKSENKSCAGEMGSKSSLELSSAISSILRFFSTWVSVFSLLEEKGLSDDK